MTERIDWYDRNPMTTRDRRLSRSPSPWIASFACEDVRPLIVCRGPIRKEAMDVFEEMGITHYGILLSEKDSIVYPQALAPELREMRPEHVHRVRDYTGSGKEERTQRMQELVEIAKTHGYTHVFAGYGFMAEDEQFVRTLEEAGLVFIGPRSSVQSAAGRKDQAKTTALREEVSVTPGIDDATTRVLLRKHPDKAALRRLAAEHGLPVRGAATSRRSDLLSESDPDPTRALPVDPGFFADQVPLSDTAKAVLEASYAKQLDLYSVDELAGEIEACAAQLFLENPGSRVRLKAIGGGGGKGQRIMAGIAKGAAPGEAARAAAVAPALVREILSEVKASGVGDNKNILLELNVEETRHNEIQLLGNGQWCVSLGGRDCSLQMHEQKLLEVSVTQEGLAEASLRAKEEGRAPAAHALDQDLETLRRMEAEAERFGAAVGLDSASTFECIVSGERHFFMEVNTRIQVEHRVSELCYCLRFLNPNPAEPSDYFDVTSLVEAMVLVARHKERLPRPARIRREGAAVEARLNATDRALSPHAGGSIISWTDPIEHEIRDDQGICTKNPDTGVFVHYRLAGAYDSNVALLVTYGDDRQVAYDRLCEILRRAKLRGSDLQTNLAFHYGLVHWFLARGVWAKPTTGFVVPYLTQVGLLHEETDHLDLIHAWTRIGAHREAALRASSGATPPDKVAAALAATRRALQLKETLLQRPLDALFEEPHALSAWLSRNLRSFRVEEGRVRWLKNPLSVLADTYWLLNMDWRPGLPAAHVIWEHDRELLDTGLGFYGRLESRLGSPVSFEELEALLASAAPPGGFDAATWARVRASHAGFQAGLELLDLLPLAGERTRFQELRVEADLRVVLPERLLDKELQTRMRKVLVPPPVTKAGEIVAVSGGMYYSQEAPHLPPFVSKGSHFEKGEPLYIIEVMKMFNKVLAPFAGTVDAVLMEGADGSIVAKGQPLFLVTPTERVVEEDPKERARRRRERTESYLERLLC